MTGPHPAYSNPPIEPQYFQPSRFEIANITLGITTLVETTEDQNYVIGQLIRLIIPQDYGSYQLNNVEGYVIEIPSDTEVVVDIDSRFSNPYISSPTLTFPNFSISQIMAIGEINSGSINASGRINLSTKISGSFINISPS